MGYVKIWVHLVWTTKNRESILTKEIRRAIFNHIRENAENKGIYIDFINGHLEHVHCLISLGSGQNIDKLLMLLKGESSYWINKNKIFKTKFEWQDEYFAVLMPLFRAKALVLFGCVKPRPKVRGNSNHE
jgi:REP element-mobilizing transposase RayT